MNTSEKNKLRFEVIAHDGGATKPNVDKPAAKPVSQPVRQQPAVSPAPAPAPAQLLIKRSWNMNGAVRKIAVRVDEKDVFYVDNGGALAVKLNPGRHRIDVKLKPMLGGEVHWDSAFCLKDVFKEEMKSGQEYTIDLANFLRKLFV